MTTIQNKWLSQNFLNFYFSFFYFYGSFNIKKKIRWPAAGYFRYLKQAIAYDLKGVVIHRNYLINLDLAEMLAEMQNIYS